MTELRQVRVAVVSPHALPRLGMVRLLESLDGIDVVAHAAAAVDATRLVEECSPDVVLIDAELAALDGMRVVADVKRSSAVVRVLLLADRASPQVEGALEAGADGYTLKDISLADFHSTIDRVAAGEAVLHPAVASVIAKRLAANGKEKPNGLTPRQREILRLLAAGLENKQIARRLGIGVHTVKTHVSRILAKLGATSRTEAVVFALRDHLIN